MGLHYKKDFNLGRLALLAWFVGGIGGISIDIDHILPALTKGSLPCDILHVPITAFIFAGCAIASLGGLGISLVLIDNDKDSLIEKHS